MNAFAGIQIVGTRVIFLGDKKETSVFVHNSVGKPTLVQAWIESAQGEEDADVPFLITPSLLRIESDQQAVLRILRISEENFPEDREALFWFNAKEIPEAPTGENVLQFSMTTRLKLFFRPAKLAIKVGDAYTKLSWHLSEKDQQAVLIARNPTPYFITLSALKINGQFEVPAPHMVPPFSEATYPFDKNKIPFKQIHDVSYKIINDYGVETKAINATIPKQ